MTEPKIYSLFGVRLHWGEPHHSTKVRAYTGSISSKMVHDDRVWSNTYTDHQITHWYGLSFRLAGFLGWQRFGETSYPRETGPLPY